MVDNEKTALLHYGLTQADIIYEMQNSTMNGGVTRFMCIVKDWDSITQFGSIRSVRPTNFMIAPEYDAVVIHDGGPYYIDAVSYTHLDVYKRQAQHIRPRPSQPHTTECHRAALFQKNAASVFLPSVVSPFLLLTFYVPISLHSPTGSHNFH